VGRRPGLAAHLTHLTNLTRPTRPTRPVPSIRWPLSRCAPTSCPEEVGGQRGGSGGSAAGGLRALPSASPT